MRICVLTGGKGTEREVAYATGTGMANALIESGHAVALHDLCADSASESLTYRTQAYPTYNIGEPLQPVGKYQIGKHLHRLVQGADVVVPALHGGIGEDGTLQMLLSAWGICYTGSASAACRIAMDKVQTKTRLRREGIATADWVEGTIETPPMSDACESYLGYPCVIKPRCGGSSVGVTIAKNAAEFSAGLSAAFAVESAVFAERYVKGREFSVSVLAGEALPPVEILPKENFYDYGQKYFAQTKICCPAELDVARTHTLKTLACRVFATLGLRDYGRIDFLLSEAGEAICLEANALPGMTSHSLFPCAAQAAGISYVALCQKLVEMAKERGCDRRI